MSDINRIINGYTEAKDASEYAEALALEMQQTEGEDYQMVWSTSYSGSYPPEKG